MQLSYQIKEFDSLTAHFNTGKLINGWVDAYS